MSKSKEESTTISYEQIAKQWQDSMIDSWSSVTKQVVASDAFTAASSAYLDWMLNCQKQIRSNSAQFMDSLEFPKRSDIARISKQVSNAETRVADCEERLDQVLSVLKRLEKKIDAIQPAHH